jgi:hypothetical protein
MVTQMIKMKEKWFASYDDCESLYFCAAPVYIHRTSVMLCRCKMIGKSIGMHNIDARTIMDNLNMSNNPLNCHNIISVNEKGD